MQFATSRLARHHVRICMSVPRPSLNLESWTISSDSGRESGGGGGGGGGGELAPPPPENPRISNLMGYLKMISQNSQLPMVPINF